ncbi:PREDICTED: uncharacterized protein LOC109207482 [Nicotiana attenuata]|uniref:Uncharacterized protein n=1 Tax=Nicotiana attenuata TaxID=49451 RepID=A0A1J6J501_NICAT|nr:PREDICTED: uncharacterized protein LOC109207482 [Nicotiana attenuata]OIT05995.1 hypothetical protein A4A49_39531 [Nicotiana attenuata]
MENTSHNDVDSLCRNIQELRDIQRSCIEDPESCDLELKKLLEDSTLQFKSKVEQILYDASEISFSSDEDIDEFWEYLKNELSTEEAKNAKIADEIEGLSREYVEGYSKLVNGIEGLSCSLELIESQGLEQGRVLANFACSTTGEDNGNLSNTSVEYNFKILELGIQLEESEMNLKSLQDLESTLNRLEAMEEFEDACSGLKIVEFEGNCIRLSLRTSIPNLESLLHNQNIVDVVETPEKNHELLIELMDGTKELKHAEIFPNDVYISEITDAATSFRQAYSVTVLEDRCFLEWLVRRVQDRIVLCTLRQFLVKSANNARHSFEYMDREEMIVAHMVGGIDAFIKPLQGWPLTSSGLTLMSLKSSSHSSKEIPLTVLCKVAEVANSLDTNSRQTISVFADRVEEILMQQMSAVISN